MADAQKPRCKNLVLDAGPLLSLSPLRGLAETYYTTPQVLAELKDSRAREHFEKLGLLSGVNVAVKSPDPSSLATVIQWAKKTGDYSVLSHADMCVIALTFMLNEENKKETAKEQNVITEKKEEVGDEATAKTTETGQTESQTEESFLDNLAQDIENIKLESTSENIDVIPNEHQSSSSEQPDSLDEERNKIGDDVIGDEDLESLQVELHPIRDDESPSEPTPISPNGRSSPQQLYDDPSDEDDGEGEWITPQNVTLHKSRALDLLPDDGPKGKGKAKDEFIGAGCMTADFAMQNVLLQMGLNLVSVEGKRIQKVRNYVLRCHACFKVCKDHSKKFCPSCGNPSLLRATVTISAPGAAKDAPVMQVHLKPNFQYRIRGTKYSIPAPKPGSAKTGPGEGLVLREDQAEWFRTKKRADAKKEREEGRMLKGMLSKGVEGNIGAGVNSWMDPDWVPEIISVGSGGKGRTTKSSKTDGDGMPKIGYGRKNPNERRRRK